ncbi:MAG: hypothetical protein ACD_10C00377G0001 [uncultured bacterium]|nr:MAG: hypothetical protein ACD_10C00377G0001 [uncultured bacterium]
MHDQLPLDHIEITVSLEMRNLFVAGMFSRETTKFRVSAEQLGEIRSYIGPRLTRLALSRAGFVPAEDGTEDYWTTRGSIHHLTDLNELNPSDFGDALAELDVNGRLAAALGLE